jgi:hypothetical protein
LNAFGVKKGSKYQKDSQNDDDYGLTTAVAYAFGPSDAITYGVAILFTIKPTMDVRSEC